MGIVEGTSVVWDYVRETSREVRDWMGPARKMKHHSYENLQNPQNHPIKE